jgi:hypothetical protein
MLFFKEFMEEKMNIPGFKRVFDQECHVCSTTLKIISRVDEVELARESFLSLLGELAISQKEFNDLYWAENCDPEVMIKLCSYLGIDSIELINHCPKINQIGPLFKKVDDRNFSFHKIKETD